MNARNALLIALLTSAGLALNACDKKPAPDTAKPASGAANHDHDDHDHDHDDDHGHAAVTQLGQATVGPFTIKASVEGDIKAGAEAHLDFEITGGKPVAVRTWIGTADGQGSMKSKAEPEEHGYHAHADAPDPITSDTKIFVAIEDDAGKTHVAYFDLKR